MFGCVSIPAFALLVGIPIGTASSAVGVQKLQELSKWLKKKEQKA